MSAQTPRPMCLLSLEEEADLSTKISKVSALADLLNCVYHGPSDGVNPESLEWISAMLFEYAGDVEAIYKKGSDRESEARGVKAPEGPQPSE
ncbi:MAG: hypothetical protein NTY36_01965 [Deltaproteobacteria bacterium]|nr:hypothetical protein [Deltaproteobacteria bacterium]